MNSCILQEKERIIEKEAELKNLILFGPQKVEEEKVEKIEEKEEISKEVEDEVYI